MSSFPSFILLVSWGWFWAQSSSILQLFEFCFLCSHLFYKKFQVIQNEVKQAFRLPFDWIVRNLMNELAWFLFLLLPHWCLWYIWGGCSSQQKVSACFKIFMACDWFFLQKESLHASCAPYFFHSWENFLTIHFH